VGGSLQAPRQGRLARPRFCTRPPPKTGGKKKKKTKRIRQKVLGGLVPPETRWGNQVKIKLAEEGGETGRKNRASGTMT